MSLKTYKINLKPLEPYFFGSEVMSLLGIKKDYYQESGFWPQQSAFLGFMRHQLLIQNNVFPINASNVANADALIGEKSFRTSVDSLSFGAIKQLYPLLLERKKSGNKKAFYLSSKRKAKEDNVIYDVEPMPSDACPKVAHSMLNTTNLAEFRLLQKSAATKGNSVYTAKAYFEDYLFPLDGQGEAIALKDVQFELEKPGVQKNHSGKKNFWDYNDQEEGYYKFVYKNIAGKYPEQAGSPLAGLKHPDEQWSFVTWIELDSTKGNLTEGNHLVQFGAERSMFSMEIKLLNGTDTLLDTTKAMTKYLPYNTPQKDLCRVTLLSDTFLPSEDYAALCSIVLTDQTMFRAMKTENQNFVDNRDRYNCKPNATSINWLLKRGSVLYCSPEKLDQLKHMLMDAGSPQVQNFRKIGYNHFIIEKP